jgi:hypothetical protein
VTVPSDWPGRAHAETLRQWPTFAHVARRVAEAPTLDGLIIAGSFADGRADDVSDVDFIVVVAEGRFEEAWEQRAHLQPAGTLAAWDVRRDPGVEQGAHKFLTGDIIKVECGMSTASLPDDVLADPFAVVVGDANLGDRFHRIGPIPPEVLEEYAQKLREEGGVPEVETLYGQLVRAIRAARAG